MRLAGTYWAACSEEQAVAEEAVGSAPWPVFSAVVAEAVAPAGSVHWPVCSAVVAALPVVAAAVAARQVSSLGDAATAAGESGFFLVLMLGILTLFVARKNREKNEE